MAPEPHQNRPVAVYTDIEDTDVSAGVALLEAAGFEVRVLETMDPERIVEGAADATALLVGYAEIDRATLERLPSVRIVSLMSMGFNNVDIDAASELGKWVTNVPGVATEEVAAHALALALGALRGVKEYAEAVTAGEWNSRSEVVQPRVSGLTLGLVGLGKIGAQLAAYARPLFARVLAYDPFVPRDEETLAGLEARGITLETLETVRRESHVLSIHTPLTAETERMVDEAFIAQMPRGSYLVNVSRGQLIDSHAVRAAVESGHLAGVGLDVLDEEPPTADHPLLGHPRITVTPHIAYFSAFTAAEYVRVQAQNPVTLMLTGTPDSPVAGPNTDHTR